MKRAFPNQVNSAPACEADANATTGLFKSVQGEVNRRVRLSAATLGLAISMGASSLLLPGQGETARATEPDAAANTQAALSPAEPEQAGVTQIDEVESSAKATADSIEQRQSLLDSSVIKSKKVKKVNSELESDRPVRVLKTKVAPLSSDETVIPETDSETLPISDSWKRFPSTERKSKVVSPSFSSEPSTNSLPVQRTTSNQIEPSSEQGFENSVESSEEVPHSNFVQPRSYSPRQPLRRQSQIETSSSTVHQVAPGETLYSISSLYGVSQSELEALNQSIDPTLLTVGESIVLPNHVKRITPAVVSVFGTQLVSNPTTMKASEPKVSLLEPTEGAATALQPISDESTESELIVAEAETQSSTPEVVSTTPVARTSLAANAVTEDSERRLATKLKNHSERSQNPYADELRAEVSQLRSKYRVRREIPTVNVAASGANLDSEATNLADGTQLAESARQINPEFNPEQHTAALQSAGLKPWAEPHARMDEELQHQEATADEAAVAVTPVSAEENGKVSVAPLGASNYAPIRPPQLVSPELPTLSSPQAYLPKPSGYNHELNGYIWPSQGILTSGYGWRWGRMHKGIDIAADVGTPVVAAAPGVVTYASWNDGGYGNLVEITHSDGSVTVYAHNDRILVQEGQEVEQGEQISEMGSTGFSTGPHLHFEVHPPGQGAIDPMAFLPAE